MSKHLKETERLRKIVESFPKVTITVVGDLVADEFVFGEISRVSREAPVLILKHREREAEPNRHLQRELVLAAREYARASDALLLSDYGYGAATPAILNAIRY